MHVGVGVSGTGGPVSVGVETGVEVRVGIAVLEGEGERSAYRSDISFLEPKHALMASQARGPSGKHCTPLTCDRSPPTASSSPVRPRQSMTCASHCPMGLRTGRSHCRGTQRSSYRGTARCRRPLLADAYPIRKSFELVETLAAWPFLVPGKAALASVRQLPVGGVDLGRDLGDCGIPGVESWHRITRGGGCSGTTCTPLPL